MDSLYQDFAKKSERRFQLGETNYLEMITAKSKQKQLQTLYKQTLQEVELAREQLKSVVQIDAIDIDRNAFEQAEENVQNSNWKDRISVYRKSLQQYSIDNPKKYDLIVSNPPYFVDSSKSSSALSSFRLL